MEENGYCAFIGVMHPRGASPKNDVLFGWPRAEMGEGGVALEQHMLVNAIASNDLGEYLCGGSGYEK